MSQETDRKWNRVLCWGGLALIIALVASMLFVFRVPLALTALRRGVAERQAEWVVLTAGESAVPYLRSGLDDPNRAYAGLCARYLVGLADILLADGRVDVLEEAVRSTNHVSFQFRPAYPKGSSALGFIRWSRDLGAAWYDVDLRLVVEEQGRARDFLVHRFGGGPGGAWEKCDILDPQAEVERSSAGGAVIRLADHVWLDRMLRQEGTLRWRAYARLHAGRAKVCCELLLAQTEVRVVKDASFCPDLPQPIDDPSVDAWVQSNLRVGLGLFQRDVMLRLRSPGGNPGPLCFTITIEFEDGRRFVRPRHLVFQPGELMPMADYQTGLEVTEPGTYRMRVILEGTPEAALSRPAVTDYWAGRYESPWQTVTVSGP